jgi:hypothetical protein
MTDTVTAVVVAAGIIASIAVIVWFFLNRQNPENAASHADATTHGRTDQLHRGVDRPAGPAAEPMDPEQLGGDQSPPT